MAKASKLASGKWRVQVNLGKDASGKVIRKSITADTKKDAERMANQFAVDYQRNHKKLTNPVEYMTLGEAMASYIELKKGEGKSITTIKGYEKIMRNDFLDIQGYRLCDLSIDRIQMSLNASASRKPNCENCTKGLSKKTLQNANGFLRSVMAHYYPDFNYRVNVPRGQVDDRKKVLYDLDTLNKLVRGTNVELAVLLGLQSFRMSEILGFRKCDVDMENGYITVRQTVVYDNGMKIIRPYGKTEKSMRTVRLAEPALEIIKALPEEQEYLVPESDQTVTKRFYRLQEVSGLEHMSFHSLRHIHASITKSLGIDDSIRQALGGWSNDKIMNGTYTHILENDRVEAENKVVEFINIAYKNTKKAV